MCCEIGNFSRILGSEVFMLHPKKVRLSWILVLESVLFVLTEGCSWRAIDRPQARWNSVYQYFRGWCRRGTLQKVLTQFGPELAPGWHFVDSTPRQGSCRRIQSCRRTSLRSHRTHQGRSKYQDSCPGQCALASRRHCLVRWEPSRDLSSRRAHRVPARTFYPHWRQSL
jgi:transposase